MARGTYAVPMNNVTLTSGAGASMVFVNPGTTASLVFKRAYCSQIGTTTSTMLNVVIQQQATAFPTLTSATPAKTAILDAASVITGGTAGAAGTAGVNASAAGAGTKTVIIADSFNVLNGWLWVPTPDEVIVMSASGSTGLGLAQNAAFGATVNNWSAGLVYSEM